MRAALALSVLGLVAIFGALIAPVYHETDLVQAAPGTATASVLTFVSSNVTASASLALNSIDGNFTTSAPAQKAAFSISTNNYTGYTVMIAASGNTTALNDNNSHTLTSISSATSAADFADVGSVGQALNGKWGYLPNFYNSTANTSTYYPAPTSLNAVVLNETSAANSSNGIDNADDYTIGLGFRADYTIPSGTYTNSTLVIHYLANPVDYVIDYSKGGIQDNPSGMPATQSGAIKDGSIADSITLSSDVPTRTGYTFAGWCYGTLTDADGTVCGGNPGTVYAAGGSFGIDNTSNNSVTLYALWSYGPYNVEVDFAGIGVSSVTFTASGHTTRTVSSSGGVASLDYNVDYSVTMNFTDSTYYMVDSWTLNDSNYGTLGSTSLNPTTFRTNTSSNSAVITATGKYIPRTISFNANNGAGRGYTQEMNGPDYLSGNNFSRSNYYFKGWSTTSGVNNTVEYRAGQKIMPSSNLTLYAVWGESTTNSLYDIVASLNYERSLTNTDFDTNSTSPSYKGLNGNAGIKATITKDNSGVFSYHSGTFGDANDGMVSRPNTIYMYRGILDSNLDGTSSTYGSNGNSANYPNYVKLGNTCWRIVRTTMSGGVKMIYNGLYSSGTTANSCANATSNAQVTTRSFNSANDSIVYAGYTYNDRYTDNSLTNGESVDEVLGSDSDPGKNNTRSTIKTYIEDTWYASNLSAYTSILEASAGYCNDRSAYINASGSTLVTNISLSSYVYFGAYTRNLNTNSSTPSLGCSRGTVDLYRYAANSTGVSNELKYPVALLTADEASFAGSGSSTASHGSAYDVNSFLRSGSNIWLLSPSYRVSSGETRAIRLVAGGSITSTLVSTSGGVRPVISLISGTTAASGSGTATDPWVVAAP